MTWEHLALYENTYFTDEALLINLVIHSSIKVLIGCIITIGAWELIQLIVA